ncbi:MAG: AMP-dependent synthetase/ligase [Phocaeicola sp.]|uniref:AMP-dependent synthetase/ligase n=1 Tax=Phocaeicola sp. TaxID=2773926 RepID=UPI003F9FBF09
MSTLMSHLIQNQAKKFGNHAALKYKNQKTGKWVPISWNKFAEVVTTVSNALLELGVGVQENIAVFSQNMPECLYTDYGAYGIRAVTIPFYATSSEAQIHYMLNDASVRFLFVGEQLQYEVACRVMSLGTPLKKIIIYDRNVKRYPQDTNSIYFDEFLQYGKARQFQKRVDKLTKESLSSDIANILYTSGTTGDSKGVMLLHSNYEAVLAAHHQRFPDLGPKDVVMNFLPYTHVFERGWTYWCISEGCTLAVNLYPKDIQQSLREVHPTCMCSVPRFFEKVYHGVKEVMNEMTGMKKSLVLDAIKVGRDYNINYVSKNKSAPFWLRVKYKFYERMVFYKVREQIGLENGRFFPTAGAAIPKEVQEFILSIGINMITGYGLTESLATVSCEQDHDHVIGSVGTVMPHVQVKIGENNEILLKGAGITPGYYKKEALTKAVFTEDGWLRTGDAGYLKDGHLFLTERLKDLFKTSNGKYIAPQSIESRLVVDRYIDQITIIADQRKFVSALIVPNYDLIKSFAKSNGIVYTDMNDLVKNQKIIDLFTDHIETLQQQFAHYEQIKKFTLLPEPFSMEREELTNTLKIRRSVVAKNYAKEIAAMYVE